MELRSKFLSACIRDVASLCMRLMISYGSSLINHIAGMNHELKIVASVHHMVLFFLIIIIIINYKNIFDRTIVNHR